MIGSNLLRRRRCAVQDERRILFWLCDLTLAEKKTSDDLILFAFCGANSP
jgi:hypothetical protein